MDTLVTTMKHSLLQVKEHTMKISVLIEDDGCETMVVREVAEGYLPDVLQVFEDALRGASFSYVTTLAAEKDDGSLMWSDWN